MEKGMYNALTCLEAQRHIDITSMVCKARYYTNQLHQVLFSLQSHRQSHLADDSGSRSAPKQCRQAILVAAAEAAGLL